MVCEELTQSASDAFDQFIIDFEKKLAEEKWLENRINDVCSALVPSLNNLLTTKSNERDSVESDNDVRVTNIVDVSSNSQSPETELSLMSEFQSFTSGLTTACPPAQMVSVPMGCSASIMQIEMDIVDVCG